MAPEPGDIIVTKRRVSAFACSDLDVILRAGEIDHLVLTGIATSGVVGVNRGDLSPPWHGSFRHYPTL